MANKVRRLLAILTILAALVWSCSHNSSTGPTAADDRSALFVQAGANGNGTADAPLGSIQAGIDSAVSKPTISRIYVATGTYHESVVARKGIAICGGRNPLHNWEQSVTDSTIVMGQSIENHSIAIAIRGIDSLVLLSHLTVFSQDAQDSSGSSYGIYCADAANVEIVHCLVIAGKGKDGVTGQNGRPGGNGDNSNSWWFGHAVQGGAGGHGGTCPVGGGYAGDSGASYLDSPPGGAGGAGGLMGSASGQRGGDGLDGSHGKGASAGIGLIYFESWEMAFSSCGQSGARGGFASGGGGGGGGASFLEHDGHGGMGLRCTEGPFGGGGGAGAGPGEGGAGGNAGGSSIAMLTIQSTLLVVDCVISSSSGGRGGNGGLGAKGGMGAIGGQSMCTATCPGSGGDGGNGGDGGSGGGGSGGSSIALLTCQSTVDLRDNVTLQFGIAGDGGVGGGNSGNNGAVGIALARYEVAIQAEKPLPSSRHSKPAQRNESFREAGQ